MRWTILALALSASGCAIVHGPEPIPGPNTGVWARERDRFTRRATLYDWFDDRAFVTATYQAPSVRQARVDRIAVWQSLNEPEKAALAEAEASEAAAHEDFLLSVFMGNRRDNDFNATRSIWKITVVVPGEGELESQQIEGVRADATVRFLYPEIGDFDTVYMVHFPRWEGPRPLAETSFILRIAGAPGKMDLHFGPR